MAYDNEAIVRHAYQTAEGSVRDVAGFVGSFAEDGVINMGHSGRRDHRQGDGHAGAVGEDVDNVGGQASYRGEQLSAVAAHVPSFKPQTFMKAVQFDSYGGIDVLKVRDVPRPLPGAGEVLVEVRAAGINISEAVIRSGALHDLFPATFPSGEGSDLAGVVAEIGSGVTGFAVGDEVIGFSMRRSSHAEYVTVPADQLTAKPSEVSWEVAGSLFVAGATAYGAVRAVRLEPGDTVAIAGAAGGVGSIAVQLARRAGATVLGIAGPSNDAWLAEHGAVPVNHGDDLPVRLRAAAPSGHIDAFLDFFGGGYVAMAVEDLSVPRDRVDTITDFDAVKRFGVQSAGGADAATAAVVAELADLVARGDLDVPIAGVFALDDVRNAYRELELRHTHGKLVLRP